MPAGLPGATAAQDAANPNQGACVLFDLLSGPKGSPLDKDQAGNYSTGALSTGIGFGSPPIIDPVSNPLVSNTLFGIRSAGFSDDYTPGVTKPDGTAAADSTLCYIGGGRTKLVGDLPTGAAVTTPYTAGFGIGMAGNGGNRDAGAGPAYTGFPIKMVTAAAGVATAGVIETGFANRSGVALVTSQSTFGSGTTASAAVA